MNEEQKEYRVQTTVQGIEIQMHHQLIGALLKRIGVDEIELTVEEIGNIKGILIYIQDGKIKIRDGGFNNG